MFWPPDAKNWLIWKDPDVGKDWRQKEKGMTVDEMIWWHHWLNGHEFEWTPGVGDWRETWRAAIHEVAKSRTWLSDWTELIREFFLILEVNLIPVVSESSWKRGGGVSSQLTALLWFTVWGRRTGKHNSSLLSWSPPPFYTEEAALNLA